MTRMGTDKKETEAAMTDMAVDTVADNLARAMEAAEDQLEIGINEIEMAMGPVKELEAAQPQGSIGQRFIEMYARNMRHALMEAKGAAAMAEYLKDAFESDCVRQLVSEGAGHGKVFIADHMKSMHDGVDNGEA